MKRVLIAFDIDGTLRDNGGEAYGGGDNVVANERVRTLLVVLSTIMKNARIMVWSGGGELYARQVCRVLGIDKYVDTYADKRVVGCKDNGCLEPNELKRACVEHANQVAALGQVMGAPIQVQVVPTDELCQHQVEAADRRQFSEGEQDAS